MGGGAREGETKMTADAIHAALADVFPVRCVEVYGAYWRIFLYDLPFRSDETYRVRCERVGLQFAGRSWDAERGHWLVVKGGSDGT